jgi:hypothetical protein
MLQDDESLRSLDLIVTVLDLQINILRVATMPNQISIVTQPLIPFTADRKSPAITSYTE